MVDETGAELKKVYGPGVTGIKNLGNTCYMASVFQILFTFPKFYENIYISDHIANCQYAAFNLRVQIPANCFDCQFQKLCGGLLSGDYSKEGELDNGISPDMIKILVGKDHPEFSSMRQQDAQEFFGHFLTTIERKLKISSNLTDMFKFTVIIKMKCEGCGYVKYIKEPKTESLMLPIGSIDANDCASYNESLEMYFGIEKRDFDCPICKVKTKLLCQPTLESFPDVLVTPISRFVIGDDYVVKKLNVKIHAPARINLAKYKALPKNDSEPEFSDDVGTSGGESVDFGALSQLMAMGFTETRSKIALKITGNQGADLAMNWLFDHMDEPEDLGPNESDISIIQDMGFSREKALHALKQTDNLESAIEYIFSHANNETEVSNTDENVSTEYILKGIISHRGTSTQCGHYVAHIDKNGWLLFNDEKVVEVGGFDKIGGDGYIYFYERC